MVTCPLAMRRVVKGRVTTGGCVDVRERVCARGNRETGREPTGVRNERERGRERGREREREREKERELTRERK